MRQEKQGSFKGLTIITKKATVEVNAVFSFLDGSVIVPISEETADNFIASFSKRYGIGIANKNVYLKYVDYDKPLAFITEIWNKETNRLSLILDNLKGSGIIKRAAQGIKPDVNIVNYGITADMNTLVKVGNIPDELRIYKAEEAFLIPVDIKDAFQMITVPSSCVESYMNDYGNESWNGPQCYGGVSINGMPDKSEVDYDFGLGRFLNRKEYEWNDNTMISFSKGGCYEIICLLSDISFFKPFGKDTFYSGIDDDIRLLCNMDI